MRCCFRDVLSFHVCDLGVAVDDFKLLCFGNLLVSWCNPKLIFPSIPVESIVDRVVVVKYGKILRHDLILQFTMKGIIS